MLRESRDFSSLDDYRAFLQNLLQKQNKRVEKALVEERAFLKPLPERKACDYTEERIRVTSSSTVCVRQVLYSVPSRLIGMVLKIHLYDDRLECYVGGDLVITLQRIRRNKKRLRSIDYRHIVGSLVQKPQAFRNYIYREELFPTLAFRQTWERLNQELDHRKACREYVNILNEAARSDNEKMVNDYLEKRLVNNCLPKSEEVRALRGISIQHPSLKDLSAELSNYDVLLVGQGGAL
jgi:hypothetical protein